MASYKNKFGDKTPDELLEIGYLAGKDMLELNKPKAKLDNERRKLIHRILQLLNLDYVGLSDAQKCILIYDNYKTSLKNKDSNVISSETDGNV